MDRKYGYGDLRGRMVADSLRVLRFRVLRCINPYGLEGIE